MALSAYVGSFNIDTTKTAGQTQAITGVGFQPKVILFWWSGSVRTTDGVQSSNMNFGIGAGDGTTETAIGIISNDVAPTSATARYNNTTAALRFATDATPTFDGNWSLTSMDASGFTLTCNAASANAWRVSYLALGGSDLTNVAIGNKARNTATGNWSVTGLGFQPTAVILWGAARTTTDGSGANAILSIGMATDSANQGVVTAFSRNGRTTMETAGYAYGGEILAEHGVGDSISQRDAFVSFDSGGFTLNQLEGTTATYYSYIALRGGQYKVGNLLSRTDTNDIVVSGLAFSPAALLLASSNRALSTQDTPTSNAALSIGAGTSTTNRATQSFWDTDGVGDSNIVLGSYDSAIYSRVYNDAIDGLMDIKSIDSGGFTCVMDDVDRNEAWVTYLAIGNSGGEAKTATLTTTLANSDSISKVGSYVRLLTTTEAISDVLSRVIAYIKVLTTTEAISDTLARSAGYFRSSTASVGITDSVSKLLVKVAALADSLGITDSVSKVTSFVRSTSESVGITDTISKVLSYIRSITDTEANTDSLTRAATILKSISDSVGLTDTLARIVNKVVTLADNLANTDSISYTKFAVIIRSISDSLGITDAITNARGLVRTFSNTVGITDTLTKIGTFIKSLFDTVGITDTISRTASFFRTIADNLANTDSLTAQKVAGIIYAALADTLGITDSISKVLAFVRNVTNTENITDTLTKAINKVISLATTEAITDALVRSASFIKSIANTLGITDVIATSKILVASLADTLGITDSINKILAYSRTLTDTEGSTDTVSKVGAFVRSISTTLGITDLLTAGKLLFISLLDTLGISDSLISTLIQRANALPVAARTFFARRISLTNVYDKGSLNDTAQRPRTFHKKRKE